MPADRKARIEQFTSSVLKKVDDEGQSFPQAVREALKEGVLPKDISPTQAEELVRAELTSRRPSDMADYKARLQAERAERSRWTPKPGAGRRRLLGDFEEE